MVVPSSRALLRWSLCVVGFAPRLFAASLGASVAWMIVQQLNLVAFANLMSVLGGSGHADTTLNMALALYALSGAGAGGLHYAAEWLTATADAAMAGRLQQRLHDTILAMPARFFDQHDAAALATIVLQDAPGCQPLLRELIAAPVTQGAAIISAVSLLAGSLDAIGSLPVELLGLFVLAAVGMQILAHVTARQLGAAHAAGMQARSALAEAFENSVSAPLQIRAMGVEAQRSAAFARAVAPFATGLLRVRAASMRAMRVQATLPAVLQVVVLATLIMLKGEDLPLATAITAFLLTPRIIQPVAELLSFHEGIPTIATQAERVGRSARCGARACPWHRPGAGRAQHRFR